MSEVDRSRRLGEAYRRAHPELFAEVDRLDQQVVIDTLAAVAAVPAVDDLDIGPFASPPVREGSAGDPD